MPVKASPMPVKARVHTGFPGLSARGADAVPCGRRRAGRRPAEREMPLGDG
jgi:hypothetical protein